jgi:hypothetical protein
MPAASKRFLAFSSSADRLSRRCAWASALVWAMVSAGVGAHQPAGQRGLELDHVQRVALDVVQVAGETHPLPGHGQLGLALPRLLQLRDQTGDQVVEEHEGDPHHGDAGGVDGVVEKNIEGATG